MTSPPSSPAPSGSDGPAASCIREKLSPQQIALMRDWVECTTHSFKRIGQKLGVSASTVSRYAAEGGWQRPAGSAPPPAIGRPDPKPSRRLRSAPPRAADRRGRIVDRLWTLAERHAAVLETQPIERAGRSLQPLARLTRTLGEMDKHILPPILPPSPPGDTTLAEDRPEGRSLTELRDALQAHLDRIMEEEGYGWEVQEWWFEDGAGI
ncbi:hypothetical protein [Microvirga makkahensis]|uniref:Uncharacterized protein n=1 Tax=Microvirga makkahensis TaxID=1128670 RepID=A0A7X3MV26_9HYPH|nr:hypothetical protein [Microvirga makkahensis]MXQ13650.1 hypothetical protein [Microvirga makkahensis]